jgi:hypothetical protein
MKTTLYSLLAAAACGMAFGQTAYTTPVGYETLTLNAGVNYAGLRLQESVLVSGLLTGVTASPNTVSDSANTFALVSGKKYILEINNSGYIQLIDGSAAVGNTITTPDNLLAAGVAVGNSYSIRPASTIVSVFGAVPAGLAKGEGGPAGADQLYIPDAAGVLKVYYYDIFGTFDEPNPGAGWYQINADSSVTLISDPNTITMPYDDGFIFSAAENTSLTVSGTVKTKATMLAVSSGINYVGGISPVGATLASTFGSTPTGIATGEGGPAGADQLYIANAAGVLKVYYYDIFGTFDEPNPGPGWYQINADSSVTLVSDPSSVTMASGYLFSAASASGANVLSNVPASYSGL